MGPGDLGALMRTYAELGVPERLLEAVAVAIRRAREPFPLLLPLLWLAAAGSESELLDSPLAPSGLINGVPLYALDRHTRLGRRAIRRFAQENAEIAQFLTKRGCDSGDDGALRMAVFYADGALNSADIAMATFGRTHSRRGRGRFPQGPGRRRRRRRIGGARCGSHRRSRFDPDSAAEPRPAARPLTRRVICRLWGTAL